MAVELTEADFEAWLERYREAWEQRDPELGAALFTDDATYREVPFDPPMNGRDGIRDYWSRVTAGQRDVRFGYDILACSGDEGYCHWTADFRTEPGGDRIQFDGIFRCRFADPRTVRQFEEWWHMKVTPADGGGG